MADFSVRVVVCTHRDIKVSSLACLWVLKDCPNPKVTIEFQDGDALISRSRSVRATKFLKDSQDDLLMFIDDDVTISPMDATKLMWMAWKEKYPIIGAAYATKSKSKPGLAIRPLGEGERIRFGTNGGIYEVMDISTGCMVIRREVLEKMVKEKAVHNCVHGSRQYYPFFQHREMIENGVWEDKSEDWFFCKQARNLGFQIFCDTTIKLGHIGPYEFNWDDVYEARNNVRHIYTDLEFNVVPEQPISVPIVGNEAVKAA